MDEQLRRVFVDVFGHEGALTDETGPEEVDGWNSFGHLALVQALEAEFAVEIPDEEIAEMDTVGNIKAVLRRRGHRAA